MLINLKSKYWHFKNSQSSFPYESSLRTFSADALLTWLILMYAEHLWRSTCSKTCFSTFQTFALAALDLAFLSHSTYDSWSLICHLHKWFFFQSCDPQAVRIICFAWVWTSEVVMRWFWNLSLIYAVIHLQLRAFQLMRLSYRDSSLCDFPLRAGWTCWSWFCRPRSNQCARRLFWDPLRSASARFFLVRMRTHWI